MSLVKISVELEGAFKVQDCRAKIGVFVQKGQFLCSLKDEETGKVTKLKAPEAGKATKVLKKNGSDVKKGDLLIEFKAGGCDHPTVMKNMCAECGADLEQDMSIVPSSKSNADIVPAKIAIVHSIPELKVSSNEAQTLGKEDERRLLKHRRLVLLVDLDQTLIHTTNENVPPNMRDVKHFQLHNHPSAPWYHTKIRPKTEEFLKKISSLYELHIVTFGARMYAHTIAKFLDKDAKYFSHRILSRDECFDSRSKTANLSSLFPCGDHMVCIIDDREDVWNYAPNLVHVKPYIFFKNTGDINAPPGSQDQGAKRSEEPEPQRRTERRQSIDMPNIEEEEEESKSKETSDDVSMVSDDLTLSDDEDSNLEGVKKPNNKEKKKGTEEEMEEESEDTRGSTEEVPQVEDNDDYLPYLEDILRNIHKAYYTMHDQMLEQSQDQAEQIDLKTVIPYVKRKVLQGSNIVFSGVVPTHKSLEDSKPYKVARSLGAKVQDRISKETTHLVAARIGTAKVNEARRINSKHKSTKIHLVTPDWLWCCAERWEKAEEAVFPLYKSAPVTLRPPAHCSSPDMAFAERCPPINVKNNSESLPESMNPFLAFSEQDLEEMGKDVETELTSEESSSSDEVEKKKNTATVEAESSEDSLTGEMPKGQKRKKFEDDSDDDGPEERFRRGEDVPSDYEIASQSDDEEEEQVRVSRRRNDFEEDDEDEDEEDDEENAQLGAQLEREFLTDLNSRSSFTNE